MTTNEIKREAFVLAGWLAHDEPLSKSDADTPLQDVIARIFASPDCGPARAALIAVMLAKAIHEH